jgi:hypothetical protein
MSDRDRGSRVDIDDINSPKIDAIKTATERVSNWLHNDLREIIKPLQNLHTLPDDIADLKKRLVEQFKRLFVGQITAEMKSREANIRVAQRKATLLETHVDRKKEQLTESRERVQARYEKLAESVSKDHKADLERLDSHAYEITETIYPEQIQERFSYESPVFWTALAEHSAASAAARTSCLKDGTEAAASEVASFLDARDQFHEDLSRLASSKAVPGEYELSYWFVEVKDEDTGESHIDVLFPWDLDDTRSPVSDDQESLLREAARAEVAEGSPGRSLSEDEREIVLRELRQRGGGDPVSDVLGGNGDPPELTLSLS